MKKHTEFSRRTPRSRALNSFTVLSLKLVLIIDSVSVSSSQCYKYFNFSFSISIPSVDLLAVHLFRSRFNLSAPRLKQCRCVLVCDHFNLAAKNFSPNGGKTWEISLKNLLRSFDSHDNHFQRSTRLMKIQLLIHKNLHFYSMDFAENDFLMN